MTTWSYATSGFPLDFDDLFQSVQTGNYPPYNIYKIEDSIFVEVAVTGFAKNDLAVDYDGYNLKIEGKREKKDTEDIQYLHRSLPYRNFKREFQVRGHYEISGVTLVNGVLIVKLTNPKAKEKVTIEVQDTFPEGWLPSKSEPKLLEE